MSQHPSTDRLSMIIPLLQQRVRDSQRLVMTTAYDAVTARLADPVVNMILVGDSVANVCLGFDNTLVRTYVDGFDLPQQALAHWADDVRGGSFPSSAEAYALSADVQATVSTWAPRPSASS